MNKADLRREMLEKRASSAPAEPGAALRGMDIYVKARRIMTYISMGNEADTRFVLCGQGKEIYAPRVRGREMCAASVQGGLRRGVFGIDEPVSDICATDFDLIIVPGLAFDLSGNRVGYGKGYYDRFLAGAKGVKLGLCHDFQLVDAIAAEPHDIKMDIVVTEKRIIMCGVL